MKLSITRRAIALLCIVNLVMLPLQQALAATITKEYYHYNHQGSPIGVYDGKGNELLIQRWTPWGERQVLKTSAPASSTGALLKHGLPAHMGYTGHKELVAAGLVFMGDTRLYSPKHKRFLNPDDRITGGIRGENRSAYAYNNPIRFIDPDGHSAIPFPTRIIEEDFFDLEQAALLGGAMLDQAEAEAGVGGPCMCVLRCIQLTFCSLLAVLLFIGGEEVLDEYWHAYYSSPEYLGADYLDDRNATSHYSHAHTSPLEEEKKAVESPTTGGVVEL